MGVLYGGVVSFSWILWCGWAWEAVDDGIDPYNGSYIIVALTAEVIGPKLIEPRIL